MTELMDAKNPHLPIILAYVFLRTDPDHIFGVVVFTEKKQIRAKMSVIPSHISPDKKPDSDGAIKYTIHRGIDINKGAAFLLVTEHRGVILEKNIHAVSKISRIFKDSFLKLQFVFLKSKRNSNIKIRPVKQKPQTK